MKNRVIDINEAMAEKYIESIRPEDPEVRKTVDIGYSYTDQIFEFHEIRTSWQNPSEKEKFPFAKISFHKTKQLWKLYWMRANGKWELYKPFPESTYLEKIIEIIEKDENACFFG